MRLDAYVAEHWPDQSRSTWEKLIAQGQVTVNGVVETSTKKKVKETDTVEATEPTLPNFDGQELPVIYKDDNVMVINKPVGVLTHSKGALNEEFTVAEFVRPFTSYKADTNRPGIIHRLDRATSGVIICALNDETASMLQRQFSDRKTKKEYVAIVSKVPKETEAVLDLPINRNPNKPSTFRVDANGKYAETFYHVEEIVGKEALVTLKPKTGRTHQLRVHIAYINAPIVGDIIYDGTVADRMFLHAYSLEITLPGGNRQIFTAPVPKEFKLRIAA